MTYATIMTKRDDLKEATGVSEQSKNTVAQSLQLSNALAVGETTTLEINVVLKKPPTTNARRKGITAASVLQKLLRRCQKITSIVHSLVQSQLRKNQNWIATINTNGHNTVFKLDTGAEVTAISAETFQEMGNIQLSKTSKVLYMVHLADPPVKGQFLGKFTHKNGKTQQHVYVVVKGLRNNLLGLPAITALNLAIRVDTVTKDRCQDQDADSRAISIPLQRTRQPRRRV